MITRKYFYNITLHDAPMKFYCGIVMSKSWFPDANAVFNYVLDHSSEELNCDKSKLRVETFNRV